MRINADFCKPALVEPASHRWAASPQPGVDRVMLDRIGEEKARATSLVRYAPGSAFPVHVHSGGEEILVLSGVFSDDAGDYPAGWYLRNPPGSEHAPSTRPGAVIFVKLGQMAASETESVRIDTRDPVRWTGSGGREQCLLFEDAEERVTSQRLAPGQSPLEGRVAGAEMLVLQGGLQSDGPLLPAWSWLRLPAGECSQLVGGPEGAMVYLKTGRLGRVFGGET